MELKLILDFLAYLGITVDKLLPIVLVVGFFGFLFNKNFNKNINKID